MEIFAASEKNTAQYAVIRAEMVNLTLEQPVSLPNVFRGTVKSITDKGANILITLDCPPQFECLLPRQQFEKMLLRHRTTGLHQFSAFIGAFDIEIVFAYLESVSSLICLTTWL